MSLTSSRASRCRLRHHDAADAPQRGRPPERESARGWRRSAGLAPSSCGIKTVPARMPSPVPPGATEPRGAGHPHQPPPPHPPRCMPSPHGAKAVPARPRSRQVSPRREARSTHVSHHSRRLGLRRARAAAPAHTRSRQAPLPHEARSTRTGRCRHRRILRLSPAVPTQPPWEPTGNHEQTTDPVAPCVDPASAREDQATAREGLATSHGYASRERRAEGEKEGG
jgi:hypothetical protein